MQIKKGFTLSEVMVTLTLVGVLAALLIPGIMDRRTSPSKVMFRKAYFVLEKAVSEASNNLMAYPANVVASTDVPSEQVEQGFNNTTITPATMNVPSDANKFCYVFTQKLNIIGKSECKTLTGNNTFTTTDGIFWTIYTPGTPFPRSSNGYATLITIDVNGPDRDPNCATIAISNPTVNACSPTSITPDTYQIGVRYDGRLNIDARDTNASAILSDTSNNFN